VLRLRGIFRCGWGSTMREGAGVAAPQIMILFLNCRLEECLPMLDSVPRSARSTDLMGVGSVAATRSPSRSAR
jgi:hypothetical protein